MFHQKYNYPKNPFIRVQARFENDIIFILANNWDVALEIVKLQLLTLSFFSGLSTTKKPQPFYIRNFNGRLYFETFSWPGSFGIHSWLSYSQKGLIIVIVACNWLFTFPGIMEVSCILICSVFQIFDDHNVYTCPEN